MGPREVSPVHFFGDEKGARDAQKDNYRDLGPTVLPSSPEDEAPHYHGQSVRYGGVESPSADGPGAPAELPGSSDQAATRPGPTRDGEEPFIEPPGNGLPLAT